MISGTASDESLTGFLRRHAVSVAVDVRADRYLGTLEETWTEPDGLGIRHFKAPKQAVEIGTLEKLFRMLWEVCGRRRPNAPRYVGDPGPRSSRGCSCCGPSWD